MVATAVPACTDHVIHREEGVPQVRLSLHCWWSFGWLHFAVLLLLMSSGIGNVQYRCRRVEWSRLLLLLMTTAGWWWRIVAWPPPCRHQPPQSLFGSILLCPPSSSPSTFVLFKDLSVQHYRPYSSPLRQPVIHNKTVDLGTFHNEARSNVNADDETENEL